MAAFCWMLIEGVYLYLFVVKVYNINDKMKVSHGFSWGNYELKTQSLFDNLWESKTWITMNITISNPQVYPPSLFPYRWALQQEPGQGLKAISVKICKKWMIFSSCDFPVTNPRFMLYFVCLFFWFNWLVCGCCCCCFVISLLPFITSHQTRYGGYCVHACAKKLLINW